METAHLLKQTDRVERVGSSFVRVDRISLINPRDGNEKLNAIGVAVLAVEFAREHSHLSSERPRCQYRP